MAFSPSSTTNRWLLILLSSRAVRASSASPALSSTSKISTLQYLDFLSFCLLLVFRETKIECGTLPGFGLKRDTTTVAFHNSLAHRQSDPRPRVFRLRMQALEDHK